MAVIGKYFGQSFLSHRLHRNTIDKAVTFVGTRSIEPQACAKGLSALRDDAND
jgi:hypothetical protein